MKNKDINVKIGLPTLDHIVNSTKDWKKTYTDLTAFTGINLNHDYHLGSDNRGTVSYWLKDSANNYQSYFVYADGNLYSATINENKIAGICPALTFDFETINIFMA